MANFFIGNENNSDFLPATQAGMFCLRKIPTGDTLRKYNISGRSVGK